MREFKVLKGETKHQEQFALVDDLGKLFGYVHYGTYETEVKVGNHGQPEHYLAIEGQFTPDKMPPEMLVREFMAFVTRWGGEF